MSKKHKYLDWTTKFDIDHCDIDIDSCYIIDIQNQTVYHIKRNCTEHHFFLCKQEISRKYVPSIAVINSTETSAPPAFTHQTSWTTKTTSSYKSLSTNANTTSYINITNNALSLNAKGNEAKIAGASIAGIFALKFAVLLAVYL